MGRLHQAVLVGLMPTLEFIEAPLICDILAGTFYFISQGGQRVSAQFFVRCCADSPDNLRDPAVLARRVDALNEQFADEWERLQQTGCTDIKYESLVPNPFF